MTSDTRPESDILAPLDLSEIQDSDEWPEYELSNARVHLPNDRADSVSLLLASERYPLVVTGDVQLHAIPKAQSHRIRQQNHGRSASVELSEVRSFAYGQFDDGNFALWAGGKAGWYTIRPARAYRETYNEMVHGIRMLYFIVDAYKEERTKGSGKNKTLLPPYTAAELFEVYAHDVLHDVDRMAAAAESIYMHTDFLFASMFAGKEGIVWTKNPLYVHLRKKFPELHETVRARLAGPEKGRTQAQTRAPPKPKAQNVRQQSVDTASTTSSLKRKRGRPPKHRDPEVMSIGSSSASAASSRTNIPAKPAASKATSAPQQHKPAPSRRTRQQQPAHPPEFAASSPSEAEPALKTPAPIPEISDSESEPKPQDKRKSALRLKPTQAVKGSKGAKATSKGGKAPILGDDDSEDELASSPIGVKRRSEELPEARPRPAKRRNSRQHDALDDEGIDMPSSPSSATSPPLNPDLDATAGAPSDIPLPIHLKHVPDPVQEDTWNCALDGCTHKVYLASRPESQRLIREHYALHAYDDDERVKLVKTLKAPSLSVSHLMEKVRLQARTDGFPGSRAAAPLTGSRFPEAVVQRL